MVLPLLNMLVGKALSFLGKYSAVTLMAQGKLPLSPKPSTIRLMMKNHALTEAIRKQGYQVSENHRDIQRGG